MYLKILTGEKDCFCNLQNYESYPSIKAEILAYKK